MVPAQNRPSGETLPSLNRVPGTCSGPVRNGHRAGVEVQQMEPVDQGDDGAAGLAERKRPDPGRQRPTPVLPGRRDRAGACAGARMSIQYSTCSGTDHTGHSPSSARASSTQVTSVSVSSRRVRCLATMSQAFSSVLILSSIRRWMSSAVSSQPNTHTVARPSKLLSRRVVKNSSQSTSPLPISLC